MGPRHLALPARRGGKCFGSARRLRIAFRSTAFSPKSDARTPAHGGQAVRTPKVPRLRDERQQAKIAQARHGEFVLWRTAKTFIDSSTDDTDSREHARLGCWSLRPRDDELLWEVRDSRRLSESPTPERSSSAKAAGSPRRVPSLWPIACPPKVGAIDPNRLLRPPVPQPGWPCYTRVKFQHGRPKNAPARP
jgi:hypothetical protein